MSRYTVELIWLLGWAGDLRAHGAAVIRADLVGPHLGDLRDLFGRLGGLALEAAEDGDEVWSWHPAEWCLETAGIGLALVRGHHIVGAWSPDDLYRRTHCSAP